MLAIRSVRYLAPMAVPGPSGGPVDGAYPTSATLRPDLPRVRLVSAWNDPDDVTVWSRTLRNLRSELERLGVFDGYHDVTPWAPATRAVHRWLGLRGRQTPTWPLQIEMRTLTAISNAVARRRQPAPPPEAWLIPVNALGVPVAGTIVTWCEMSPAQIARAFPTYTGSLGYPGLSSRGLAALVRQQSRLYRRAQACCVATSWAGSSLVDEHGIAASRVKVVGYGRNIEVPPPPGRDWSTPRFLFVGKDWERKNGDAVVRAFRRLRQDLPEAELHLEGLHPPMNEDGVTGHGRLAFDTDDGRARLCSLYARSTCFVLPSKLEPFGIVYLEAAGAGLASIGTTVGGATTAVGDGGVLVDPDDDTALYRAMRRLADPATARSLGAAALARSADFSWRQSAERVVRAVDPVRADAAGLAQFL